MMKIDEILESQRRYFRSGATLSVSFRIEMLKKLRNAVEKYENEIGEALRKDLGKSDYEGFMCETGLVKSEISYMIRHTHRFASKHRVYTPLAQFASSSYKKPCPYGNVLIMSPWNYPFLLTIDPLADAIAAGNTAVVKPSAYSPATSAVIAKMLSECFPPEYVAVVTGGRKENAALLDKKFDFVFFTGSQNVGKEVLRHTAETLTPAVLELGGKSPCIVDSTAKLKLAAKRIVFGKYLNCGQTCVAPDYILVEESVKTPLTRLLQDEITRALGPDALNNPDYPKIVNQKHFTRIMELIEGEDILFGGQSGNGRISPTLLDGVTGDSPVMQEEIFGPVLPLIPYRSLEEAISFVQDRPRPLALYLFTQNRREEQSVLSRLSFGGGCVNDTIVHLASPHMPFGGVGESGMGGYHGKASFDTFSHTKSILKKAGWLDLPVRYHPYTPAKERLVKMLLK